MARAIKSKGDDPQPTRVMQKRTATKTNYAPPPRKRKARKAPTPPPQIDEVEEEEEEEEERDEDEEEQEEEIEDVPEEAQERPEAAETEQREEQALERPRKRQKTSSRSGSAQSGAHDSSADVQGSAVNGDPVDEPDNQHYPDLERDILPGNPPEGGAAEKEDDDKQRLLAAIAKENKDIVAPVEAYLERHVPEHESRIYSLVLKLLARHGFRSWWRFARDPREYFENEHLIQESWDPIDYPPKALDDDQIAQDLEVAELHDLWNFRSMSSKCREYLWTALDGTRFISYSLRERVRACVRLVKEHDIANQDLWNAAPGFERYLSGHISCEEAWPLNRQSMQEAWDKVAELFKRRPASVPTRKEFENLRRYTERLYKHSGIIITSIMWHEDITANDYVHNRLRPYIRRGAFALLKPLWEAHIQSLPPDQQRSRQEQFVTMEASEELPPTVQEHECLQEWKRVNTHFGATEISPKLLARYNDIRSLVEDSANDQHEFLSPPEGEARMSAERYIESLWRSIRQQWVDLLHAQWEDAIDQEHNEPPQGYLRSEYKRMKQSWNDGKGPWRPGENEPTSPDYSSSALAHTLGFGGARSQVPGHYNFKTAFGKGGMGQVALWVQYNSNMQITRRIVVKETLLDKRRHGTGDDWNQPYFWFGDISQRQPMEHMAPYILRQCRDSDHIVRSFSAGTYDRLQMYRVYMEYCEHGDLEQLIQHHKESDGVIDQNGRRIDHRIPTRVIWAIFEALTTAACLMTHGDLGERPPPQSWVQFFHCDFKPENVFLTAPDAQGLWPGIPMFKLGDFGLTAVPDGDPPTYEGAGGTPGYMAPEIYGPGGAGDGYAESRSDIWSIGRIMLSLVNLDLWEVDGKSNLTEYTLETAPEAFPPPFRNGAEAAYPRDLRDLIAWCLHKDPNHRPQASELWWEVHGHVASMVGLRGEPMKTQPQPQDETRLGYQPDKYMLWT